MMNALSDASATASTGTNNLARTGIPILRADCISIAPPPRLLDWGAPPWRDHSADKHEKQEGYHQTDQKRPHDSHEPSLDVLEGIQNTPALGALGAREGYPEFSQGWYDEEPTKEKTNQPEPYEDEGAEAQNAALVADQNGICSH
jgi:hypothetical protein